MPPFIGAAEDWGSQLRSAVVDGRRRPSLHWQGRQNILVDKSYKTKVKGMVRNIALKA
jgi:hypothetical protein